MLVLSLYKLRKSFTVQSLKKHSRAHAAKKFLGAIYFSVTIVRWMSTKEIVQILSSSWGSLLVHQASPPAAAFVDPMLTVPGGTLKIRLRAMRKDENFKKRKKTWRKRQWWSHWMYRREAYHLLKMNKLETIWWTYKNSRKLRKFWNNVTCAWYDIYLIRKILC